MSRRRFTIQEWRARPVVSYGTLAVDKRGKATLRGRAAPSDRIHYQRDFGIWDDEGVTYDSSQATVTLRIAGKARFLFYVRRGRVYSTTFAFNLSPKELKETAVELARQGLGAWIRPGLEYLTSESPDWVRTNRALMAAAAEVLAAR
jgi:hypothetical protein